MLNDIYWKVIRLHKVALFAIKHQQGKYINYVLLQVVNTIKDYNKQEKELRNSLVENNNHKTASDLFLLQNQLKKLNFLKSNLQKGYENARKNINRRVR